MKTIDALQGSQIWLDIRAKHFTASEAPAMMGASKYTTRSELLKQKHTGIAPEVDENKQFLFDRGHAAEAAARQIVEEILSDEFSPVTGMMEVEGLPLLASFDGINFSGDTVWECKLWNESLVADVERGELSAHYYWQLEQQLLVSGAKCVFFTFSDGTKEKTIGTLYKSVPRRRAALIAGWHQFAKDLAAYTPPEATDKPVSDAIMQLPAVTIQVTGALSACNLSDVTPLFDRFLTEANTELKTDDDFANGEATAKFSRTTAKNLKLKAVEVVDQIATVSEAVRTLELYAAKFDKLGLVLEKAVKDQKENIKYDIMADAKRAFMDHVDALYQETKPIELSVQHPDFAGVMKGQRTLESLRNKVNTELARVKIAADAVAKDVRGKLALFKPYAEFDFLFRDLQTIIQKHRDDFMLIVETRINQHKAAEAPNLDPLATCQGVANLREHVMRRGANVGGLQV